MAAGLEDSWRESERVPDRVRWTVSDVRAHAFAGTHKTSVGAQEMDIGRLREEGLRCLHPFLP